MITNNVVIYSNWPSRKYFLNELVNIYVSARFGWCYHWVCQFVSKPNWSYQGAFAILLNFCFTHVKFSGKRKFLLFRYFFQCFFELANFHVVSNRFYPLIFILIFPPKLSRINFIIPTHFFSVCQSYLPRYFSLSLCLFTLFTFITT